MKEDIIIKRIAVNLKQNKKYIEIEIPGDEILESVEADSIEFEKLVKRKVIEYIKSLWLSYLYNIRRWIQSSPNLHIRSAKPSRSRTFSSAD